MATLSLDGILTYAANYFKSKFAAKSHTHAANDITSGTLAIANGGTGATTVDAARTSLDAAQDGGATGTLHTAECSIAPVTQKGDTATEGMANGGYFIWNGTLVRATQDIARGDTISYANVDPVTVMQETRNLERSIANRERRIAGVGHDAGDYIIVNDCLFVVTRHISPGDEIMDGDNVATVVVMDELKNAYRISEGTLAVSHGGSGQSGTSYTAVVANVATAASGCTVTTVNYAQWGKVAHVLLAIRCDSAKSSGTVLATMVSGKRPVTTAILMPTTNTDPSCSLSTNGEIVLRGSGNAGSTLYVIGTYLLP